jgi:hypothetical protein
MEDIEIRNNPLPTAAPTAAGLSPAGIRKSGWGAVAFSLAGGAGVAFFAHSLLKQGGYSPVLYGLLMLFFVNTLVAGIRMIASGKRSQLTLVLIFGILAALMFAGWNVLFQDEDSSSSSSSSSAAAPDDRGKDFLAKMAEKLSKNLPRMMDQETRFDKVVAGPGEKLTYSYTLVNLTSGDMSRDSLATMLATLKKRSCVPKAAEEMRARGLTLEYKLVGKDQKPIASLVLTPANCPGT